MAMLIVDRLQSVGLEIISDHKDISCEINIFDGVKYHLQSSDFVLVLFSESLLQSKFFHSDYAQEFFQKAQQRKVFIIPVLIEKCNIPSDFLEFDFFDLKTNFDKGIGKLIDRIRTIDRVKFMPDVSFGELSHREFEELIYDLLKSCGFINIQREYEFNDCRVDFAAEYFQKNPFGQRRKELWIIETKLYSESRFDIKALKQVIGKYRYFNKRDVKLLLITNSQLNSVVAEYLNETIKSNNFEIEVVDGLLLKRLIANRKRIVNKYFLKCVR